MLTAKSVEAAKPKEKDYKLSDGAGLVLLVKTSGAKYWRFRYRWRGKEKMLAFGVVPAVSLAEARRRCVAARAKLAAGADPGARDRTGVVTVGEVAARWIEFKRSRWSDSSAKQASGLVAHAALQKINRMALADVRPSHALEAMHAIERAGALTTARAACGVYRRIFRYAVATGVGELNPFADTVEALRTRESVSFSSLKEEQIGEFLTAMSGAKGHPVVKGALRLLMLGGMRTKELRHARWTDIEGDVWRFSAQVMKARRPHAIPVTRQMAALLDSIRPITGCYEWVFTLNGRKPVSFHVFRLLLKRGGYSWLTRHGFRHTLSTVLNAHAGEQGFDPEWIEVQLAHRDKNAVRRIYNHADYMEERRGMMQWYADHLDALELL